MSPREAEWHCNIEGGVVALLHRGGCVALCNWDRRSGTVTSGEAEWRCVAGGGGVAL